MAVAAVLGLAMAAREEMYRGNLEPALELIRRAVEMDRAANGASLWEKLLLQAEIERKMGNDAGGKRRLDEARQLAPEWAKASLTD